MKQTALLLATLVFLLKEGSCYPVVTADVEDATRGEKEPSKGRELERRSAQENETAGELICETNCEGLPPEMNGWLVEMDIVRNSRIEELLRTGQGHPPPSSSPDTKRDSPGHKPRRAVIREDGWYSELMWPNGRVPFVFDGFLNGEERKVALQGMQHWMNHTCIRFVPKQDFDKDYILFAQMNWCWSYVGRQGGKQFVSLGFPHQPCYNHVGVVIHELGHVIGFFHEQSRTDRDQYIRIEWNNIKPHAFENFQRYSIWEVDSLDVPYDYNSIMHYPPYAFSKNRKPTVVALQPGVTHMGQRDGLSPLDIRQARLLYNCPTHGPESSFQNNTTPVGAFLIHNSETDLCLGVRNITGERTNITHNQLVREGLYEVILTECNTCVLGKYWQWTKYNQIFHIQSSFCLSSGQVGRSLKLKPCNRDEDDQEWLCAGRYIKQPKSADCVTVNNQSHWEEALERLLNNQTLEDREEEVVSLAGCQPEHPQQIWNAMTPTVNTSEGWSICEFPGGNSSSHAISRCYIEDMEYQSQRWTTCHWLGYYTAGFYHIDREHLNVVTGLECCANNFVFTGQPNSPITNHTEVCSETEWWSFEDTATSEGWFRCPQGMYLKGFQLSSSPGLYGIRKAKCCKPHSSPATYALCYDHLVASAGEIGVHACSLTGYHVTAVYKTDCTRMNCLEKITCCI